MHGKLLLAVTLAPKDVGQRIKAAREKRGWTQVDFAIRADVSPSSVTRWEGGKLPPVRELIRIADLLEVDPADLVEVDLAHANGDLAELRDHLDRQHDEVITRLDRIETALRDAAVREPTH